MLGGWWVQPGLLKHTAILKSYSNFIPVNAIWEMYCLCPPSVRLLRVCLLQLESIFHTSEYKRRNAGRRDREKNAHKQRRRGIYKKSLLWTEGPFSAYTIWWVALKVCFSVSLGPLRGDHPSLFFFSSSPPGLGQTARRGGERQEAMARRAWRKERPTVNRICRFLSGRLKAWIAPKACRKHGVPELQVKGSDVVAAVTSYVRPPWWT